jgi:hypothetical protein
LAALAAGCTRIQSPPPSTAGDRGDPPALTAPRPYAVITAGLVHAIVPKQWDSEPVVADDALRLGIVASPDLQRWNRMDGSVPGIEAEWVDLAKARIPSDFYYLAARGPAIPRIATSDQCRSHELRVIVNHRPAFAGDPSSPSDYAVRGTGTCHSEDGRPTRYAYFVAAPGYGPVRSVGIPRSGLYVVVAVVKGGPEAAKQLHTMLMSARFDRTSVFGLLTAARRSAQQLR